MGERWRPGWFGAICALAFLVPAAVIAVSRPTEDHDVGPVAFALALILAAAKLGADVAVRLRQPALLGELLVGILLGNLDLLGFPASTTSPTTPA